MPSVGGHGRGILSARPGGARGRTARPGTTPLKLGNGRDGLLYVPKSVSPHRLAPLFIMLHGAGASASDVLPMVSGCAEVNSVVVLAPDSRGPTWDVIRRAFGVDVAFIDLALHEIFGTVAIDPARIAIGGFSDGASYALSLGLTNGKLFSDIIAFSPGFAAPTRTDDAPSIFISHGRDDPVLPIDRCGRRVAAWLRPLGYDLDYREFVGGHVVPGDMAEAAFQRFVRPAG